MARSLKYSWLLIFFLPSLAKSQNLILDDSILVKTDLLYLDNLGRLFYTKAANELIIYDLENKKQSFTFADKRLGTISSIDVTNPLNTLIYSNQYQQVIILDRTMNPIAKYNLLDYDINQCTAVGMGVDNSIWIFDAADYKLKRFSYDNKNLVSNGFFQLFLEYGDLPNQVIFSDNNFYINIPNKYIIQLDLFGSIIKKMAIKSDKIIVIGDMLIYKNSTKWKVYDPLKLDSFDLLPSDSLPFDLIALSKNYIAGADGRHIWIFKK